MQRISITNPQNIIDGTAKKYYFKLRNTGGPKGDKGDKGDTGATGPQGPQGNAATVSVGSTTTLPVGYDATVTNSGSIYNAVLDFGIPQGPQGPQGAKGDKGDTGAKGDTGPRGPQGERGTNATVYVGTTTTTNPGTQARVYNSGTDSNAVLNFEIPRGDVGPQPELVQTTGTSTTKAMSQKATTDALNTKQATISSSNKLSADLVTDTSTTNKFVTSEDKTTWNAKQNALTAGQGIDITSDVISTPAIVPEVVASLPAEGAEGKLYLTPKAHITQTATGNTITATVAEDAGVIESFQLDGDTFQQTYTGKNLLLNEATTTTLNGITFTIASNGSVRVIGTATARTVLQLFPNKTLTLAAGTYTLYTGSSKTDCSLGLTMRDGTTLTYPNSSNTARTFTITQNAEVLSGYIIVENGSTQDTLFEPQLEEGSTATSYEPYVGGQASPNPDYPQPIQTVTGEQTVEIQGKNLYKLNTGTYNGLVITKNSEGGYVLNGTPTANVQLSIAIQEISQKHTLSFTASGTSSHVYVRTRDGGGVLQDNLQLNQTSGSVTSSKTIATSSLTVTTGETFTNFTIYPQLELGSTATAYAPYHATSYPISLGTIELCKLGTYQDYIWKDGEDWKVHKATATLTLTGASSENWYVDQYAYMLNNIISAKSFSDIANMEAYCRSFSKSATGQTSSYAVSFWYNASGTGVRFIKDQTPDLSSFRNWLASNNQTVYYPLATATNTTITDTTLISQLEAIRTASLENGTNTITNSTPTPNLAGNMEIGYYGYNPTNRYDKFIWLDLNNAYEQLNNPDTSSTLSTLSTRSLGTTTEQPTVTRSLETETITLKKGETEPIEDKTELPTILDEETEESETTEPEESDGTDER